MATPARQDYATLDETRSWAKLSRADEDVALLASLAAAHDRIDAYTHRRFDRSSTVTARTFRASSEALVDVTDIATVTGLVVKVDSAGDGTFATTLSNANLVLEPLDGIGPNGESGWPFDRILVATGTGFPIGAVRPGVQVSATWGWPEVPFAVHMATMALAAHFFAERDAKFGVAGFTEFGAVRIRGMSATVQEALDGYRRGWGIA